MDLETADALTWSLGLVGIAFRSFAEGKYWLLSSLITILVLAWLNHLFETRPPFRKGAESAFVGGLLAVPAALVALNSNHAPVAITISVLFGILFLLTDSLVPARDYLVSISLSLSVSSAFAWILDEEIFICVISAIFALFVSYVIMTKAPGSFSIGESIMVTTLATLPIKTLFTEEGIPQFCAAFIIGGVVSLATALLIPKPIAIFSAFLPFYYLYKYWKDLLEFIFTMKNLFILIYCATVCIIFILASVFWKGLSKFPQIVQRKFFHIMALLIFVPPGIIDIEFLRLAISGAIYMFLVVECLRLSKFPGVSKIIEVYVSDFLDEKDSGELILTHLFLLLGCGLPILLSNLDGFCGLSVRFCGVSVLCIGDAAASAVGVRFGKTKWPRSRKSIEGTIGAFVGTWLTSAVITTIGLGQIDLISILLLIIPAAVGALDEAFTSQIDNLTLPFVMVPAMVMCLSFRN